MALFEAIGLGLSVGSTVLGLFGEDEKADAQEKAARYRAAVSRRNAAIAREAAAEAERRGEQDASFAQAQAIQAESAHRSRVRQLIGSQRVALAGSGVMVDGGTATDIQADTAMLGEIDALTIRQNAARTERGIRLAAADAASQFEQQALQSEAEAQLAEMGAESAATQGAFNIGATLLSGASNVAAKWYDYNKAGGSGFFGIG